MKTITIEDLLSWAFIFELPKAQSRTSDDAALVRPAWQCVSDFAELGTLIDRAPNHYGVIPGFTLEGDPHPDAIAVGDAVRELAQVRFDIAEGWNPVPDIDDPHGLVAAEIARVVEEIGHKADHLDGRHMIALVTTAAVLKRGPDWRIDPPEYLVVSSRGQPRWFVRKLVRTSSGKTVQIEENGYDERSRRPKPGAYRKYELEFPLRSDILSRLDWQLWQDALGTLAGSLQPRLTAHCLAPFVADRAPWTARREAN